VSPHSTLRRQCLAWCALGTLGAYRPAVAGLFDPDVLDVEVGTSTTAVLDPNTSRRLAVRTRTRTRDIRWVDRNGRVVDTSMRIDVDNKYNWQDTVQRSTDIWQVTAEDQKTPLPLVLRVRGPGVPLVVSLFVDAASARHLEPEAGVEVAPAEPGGAEWLALFSFDPSKKTFITVQAQESSRVQYRLSVLKADRFRR
jgi:hypothetical protein